MRTRQAYVLPGGAGIQTILLPVFNRPTRIVSIVLSVETPALLTPAVSLLVTTVGPTSAMGRWYPPAILTAASQNEITFSPVTTIGSLDIGANTFFVGAEIPSDLWLNETSRASIQISIGDTGIIVSELSLNTEAFI